MGSIMFLVTLLEYSVYTHPALAACTATALQAALVVVDGRTLAGMAAVLGVMAYSRAQACRTMERQQLQAAAEMKWFAP